VSDDVAYLIAALTFAGLGWWGLATAAFILAFLAGFAKIVGPKK
jgi:hypothetical protein